MPLLGISIDSNQVLPNQTITLINGNNAIYKIVCSALNAKPDVDLFLFDSNSLLPLSNGINNKTAGQCDANNLCTKILQVNFEFNDSSFNNMNSLTCAAVSNNPNVNLTTSIQRSVSVLVITSTTSKLFFHNQNNKKITKKKTLLN